MSRVLIWDLPLRVVHWGLAGSLTAALALGLAVDDDHPRFAYHMLFGVLAGGFLGLRLVLGLVGSRHDRFASLVLRPRELFRYLQGVVVGQAQRYSGHNPGTSWLSVLLWILVPTLILTGVSPDGVGEDIHEQAAYGVLILVSLHLVGLALHTWRHREAIAWAMIDGRKEAPASAALASSGRWAGSAAALLAALGGIGVFRGFDARTGRLHLPGTGASIQLTEPGGRGDGERADHRVRHHD